MLSSLFFSSVMALLLSHFILFFIFLCLCGKAIFFE